MGQTGGLLRNAENLFAQLEKMAWYCRILETQPHDPHLSVYVLLRNIFLDRQKLVVSQVVIDG